jgi:hypothetical protein
MADVTCSMSRSAENPGRKKEKGGKIGSGKVTCASRVEVKVKLDVRE